jgi:gluconolactonase
MRCRPHPLIHGSYAFDVLPDTQAFANRRVFVFADTGSADGLAIDTDGNIWAGCGDGTEVGWALV